MTTFLPSDSALSGTPPPAASWLNRYARLSAQLQAALGVPLGTALEGHPLATPSWVITSDAAAADLGWSSDWWRPAALTAEPTTPAGSVTTTATATAPPTALDVFSGNALWPGMAPMATVYSGHQFGAWAGQLGDGRALLLGEVDGPHGPREIQLKGAGPTPYSRRGDGRAVLRSSIREFLCSEAMHALGIPTTRALCLTASPQLVRRETIESAAVVTRVAPSFIRFGHFEHFAHSGVPGHEGALAALVDFVIDQHLPHLQGLPPGAERALGLLGHAVTTTAELMSRWQAVGFCHGVMNSDNMSILGLSLDYGPFGFLDGFDPRHICNHSDHEGRYSWQRQPEIGFWNLGALAQALVTLVPDAGDEHAAVVKVLKGYETAFANQMLARWRAKLGLRAEQANDTALVQDLLTLMAKHGVDFTITFRRLGAYRADRTPDAPDNAPVRDLFLDRPAFDAWALRYAQRLVSENSVDAERQARMDAVNPWVVLRNHLAENAIRLAQAGDFSEVRRLHMVLARPYEAQPEHAADADFPPAWAASIEVSCSS